MKYLAIIFVLAVVIFLTWFLLQKPSAPITNPTRPTVSTLKLENRSQHPTNSLSPSSITNKPNPQYPTPGISATNVVPANNNEDAFKKRVVINAYDPKNPPPAKANTPAGTYYKRFGTNLVLGHWDGTNTFTPLDPPQSIDVSKSYPISLPYGELLTHDDIKTAGERKRYTDSEGKTWEEWYDAEAQTMKSRAVPNP